MSDFDVEREARQFLGQVFRQYSSNGDPVSQLAKLLNRAIAATEEECITLVCDCCSNGHKPSLFQDDEWIHVFDDGLTEDHWCDAAEIHERRRQREEGK